MLPRVTSVPLTMSLAVDAPAWPMVIAVVAAVFAPAMQVTETGHVTTWPSAIVTVSPLPGTEPPTHVIPTFQLPLPAERYEVASSEQQKARKQIMILMG